MIERPVLWTATARTDLNHIVDFIAEDDATTALVVARRIEARCETLRHHPERGRLVPELRAIDVLTHRELIEGPWRIVYRYDERSVFIAAVLDARRDLASLLFERLVR